MDLEIVNAIRLAQIILLKPDYFAIAAAMDVLLALMKHTAHAVTNLEEAIIICKSSLQLVLILVHKDTIKQRSQLKPILVKYVILYVKLAQLQPLALNAGPIIICPMQIACLTVPSKLTCRL